MKFSIVSRECVEFGIYEGATALDAYAAMLRDAGCSAEIVNGELVTDSPEGNGYQNGNVLVIEVE